jgi:threonine dehydrogenase-like Zn-dependent dehydrogenase
MERGRAVILKRINEPMVIEEFPVPDPEPGAIIIRVTQAGVCGSDLHSYRGHQSLQGMPPSGRVMGHEGNGVIHRLGKGVTADALGAPLREGDRVIHSAVMPCYHCYWCQRGEYNWCPAYPSNREAGVFPYFVGTFADYYYLPPHHPVYRVPEGMPESVLSFVNCALGTVTEGLTRAEAGPGKDVVIFGAGGLGLGATAIARHMGARQVIIFDRQPARLALARDMGAAHTVNIDELDTVQARLDRVMELTGGRGATIVMELVGHPSLMEEGVDMLASGGTFVQIGAVPGDAVAKVRPGSLLRGKKIMGSLMYRPQTLPLLMDILNRNAAHMPFDRIVSRSYPLTEVNRAFAEVEWHDRQIDVTRAVLVP